MHDHFRPSLHNNHLGKTQNCLVLMAKSARLATRDWLLSSNGCHGHLPWTAMLFSAIYNSNYWLYRGWKFIVCIIADCTLGAWLKGNSIQTVSDHVSIVRNSPQNEHKMTFLPSYVFTLVFQLKFVFISSNKCIRLVCHEHNVKIKWQEKRRR